MTNSNGSDQKKRRDRAFVSLALGIKGQDNKDLPLVTDDDLLALHHNQLDGDHKARVMHSIANNSDTYKQWIELVKTMALVEELDQEEASFDKAAAIGEQSKPAKSTQVDLNEEKKLTLADKLASWLGLGGNWTGALGKGASVAVVAVLAVFMIPNMLFKPSIDQLYEEYAASGSAILPEKSIDFLDTRESPYSVFETEFAIGLANGFNQLEINDPPLSWKLNADLYAVGYAKLERDDESAFALGRLVALSLVQCRVAKDDTFFKSVEPLMKRSIEQYDLISIEATVDGDARAEVCSQAAAIVDRL